MYNFTHITLLKNKLKISKKFNRWVFVIIRVYTYFSM
jgi:hypothetical protein